MPKGQRPSRLYRGRNDRTQGLCIECDRQVKAICSKRQSGLEASPNLPLKPDPLGAMRMVFFGSSSPA